MLKYILAVSGGVDSVVLLHLAKTNNWKIVDEKDNLPNKESEYIVAHFDHGIREDSKRDRLFVQSLAKHYKIDFEYLEGNLGANASEAKARRARYEFLENIRIKHSARSIITAHHQDDVIETAIINILRGTNYKGLSSIGSSNQLLRPLLDLSKSELIKYAKKHKLLWREDKSNLDTKYLRNYVRRVLIPSMDNKKPAWRESFVKNILSAKSHKEQIDNELEKLSQHYILNNKDKTSINRKWLIMLPNEVGQEVLHKLFTTNKIKLTNKLIKTALMFCKTAKKSAEMSLPNRLCLIASTNRILLQRQIKL